MSIFKGKSFLLVDDEPIMLNMIGELLKRQEAITRSVFTGKEALDLVEMNRYDAIILDKHLQNEDGHDILRQLKGESSASDVPVVMLTGDKLQETIEEAIKLGAAGYIGKPFTINDFTTQLSKILDPDGSGAAVSADAVAESNEGNEAEEEGAQDENGQDT